jgi:hypothetical protein
MGLLTCFSCVVTCWFFVDIVISMSSLTHSFIHLFIHSFIHSLFLFRFTELAGSHYNTGHVRVCFKTLSVFFNHAFIFERLYRCCILRWTFDV